MYTKTQGRVSSRDFPMWSCQVVRFSSGGNITPANLIGQMVNSKRQNVTTTDLCMKSLLQPVKLIGLEGLQ